MLKFYSRGGEPGDEATFCVFLSVHDSMQTCEFYKLSFKKPGVLVYTNCRAALIIGE